MITGILSTTLILSGKKQNLKLDDLAGVRKKHPFLTFILLIFVISFIGLPFTGGFIGKFYILLAAIKSGHQWFIPIFIANALISIIYLIRILVYAFLKEPLARNNEIYQSPTKSITLYIGVTITLLGILITGFFPNWFLVKCPATNPMR